LARLRASADDFVVEEIPLYEPSGVGGHTFVWLEKRGRTTEDVARELARAAGVGPRDVGYAGRKDRHAVTRQWLSVPGLDPERALALSLRDARVLRAARHPHKLRTAQLAGNRFELVVRDVDEPTAAIAQARLARLVAHGLPNRFGPQRFGSAGDNAERGRALLQGGLSRCDRREARFLASALQAAVFNEALRARPLPLDCVEAGDVAVVHASGGLFRVEDEAREGPRAAAFEISATGPIFGPGSFGPLREGAFREPSGPVRERESRALAALGLDPDAPLAPPPGIRLAGARRALRVQPRDARLARSDDPGSVLLRFTLPAGSYATVLVEELFGAERAGEFG
jgi:tRNA pseudouridine13 synthase